jgi:hypothetical protein
MTALVGAARTVTPRGRRERLRVPWGTVLPLAVVAALGSEFWLVAMRGAVGAIERTSGPFLVWLGESALLMPVYVFAVLAALTLALRWFGPYPQRALAVATTLLLVVATATLAALALQAVNAVYDYQLQSAHLVTMTSHGTCDAGCLADRQHSALLLQVRALGLNGVVMLASNLVLLALVVGFRGGRLNLASPRRQPVRPPGFVAATGRWVTGSGARAPGREQARTRVSDVELFLVAGLLGAAAIHASVVREHFVEWPAAGVFFGLLTVGQLVAAGLVLRRSRSAAFWMTVAVSDIPLVLWLCSRTVGLPFGPDAGVPEPFGVADVAAALLEISTLVLAFVLFYAHERSRRLDVTQHQSSLALVAVAAVALVGLAGALGVVGGDGHGDLPQSKHHVVTTSTNGHGPHL